MTCVYFIFRSAIDLDRFRVTEEGFSNRYRHREDKAPHCDTIYPVMYPNTENKDYVLDQNKNNYKQMKQSDKYSARTRVNGDFDMKVLVESYPDGLP